MKISIKQILPALTMLTLLNVNAAKATTIQLNPQPVVPSVIPQYTARVDKATPRVDFEIYRTNYNGDEILQTAIRGINGGTQGLSYSNNNQTITTSGTLTVSSWDDLPLGKVVMKIKTSRLDYNNKICPASIPDDLNLDKLGVLIVNNAPLTATTASDCEFTGIIEGDELADLFTPMTTGHMRNMIYFKIGNVNWSDADKLAIALNFVNIVNRFDDHREAVRDTYDDMESSVANINDALLEQLNAEHFAKMFVEYSAISYTYNF